MTESGTLLGGRYELDQIIGRGGMAEVWRARDTRLNRDVAVKRLRVDLASDPTFQARFRREAQSAAGLSHPNIVSVYDTGEERDTVSDVMVPFIVMELVEGVTLRDVLRDGRKILPEKALGFTAGVLDALAYSHRAGIIHRDIKPANIMLTPQGNAKVMDFGIARAVADTSATMTQTAAVIGTAQYLSPEQARGEKVDNRSDIYSVGCLLYELLVGEPPFKGDSPVSVAYQHVREAPVPPSQRDPEIAPEMDAITLKALAKAPQDRYQDATEFREDILACLSGQPVMAMNHPNPAEATTQVIDSDPLTTTVRRTARPAAAVSTSPARVPEPETDDEEDLPRRRAVRTTLTVLSVLLVGILGTVLYLLFFTTPPKSATQVAVPNVVGFKEEPAAAAITAAELVPVIQPRPDPAVAEGEVIETDPVAAKMVNANSKVTLYVSSGSGMTMIPEGLAGMPQEAAEKALKDVGLVPRITLEPSDTLAKGMVIGSDPVSGEVKPKSEVILKVSSGPTASTVPHGLVGLPYEEARDILRDVNFTVEREDEASDTVPSGQVIRTSPDSGASVEPNSPVTLVVSSGVQMVKVPDLVGSNEGQARRALANAGFTSELKVSLVNNAAEAPGLVFWQNISPDRQVRPTDVIEVSIAVTPATTDPGTTPDPVDPSTPDNTASPEPTNTPDPGNSQDPEQSPNPEDTTSQENPDQNQGDGQ